MQYLPLLGIVIVIVGFALKWNSMAIVMIAMFVAGLAGGMNILQIFSTIGNSFVANKTMAIFILIFPVVGLLEKNGLREIAARLIKKIKIATPGTVSIAYTVFRSILGAFNVNVGGSAGFIRPVIYPMAEGSVENTGKKIRPEDEEAVKGMTAASENFANFFSQTLFMGGSGMLLVKNTLDQAGYQIDFVKAALAELPVLIAMLIVSSIFYLNRSNKIMANYVDKK